ncbi:hypothetical protein [Sulfurospirillum halorespirans]|uniref:Uncharacterized protein n=1 Tax=Sulfurospirillum halorespirans DSM 13726 TaxID=1193502 RepID=A0A1D7THP9_9BACT|nr:hypothetical protein [Sulfurospirillum halorespirans]AOO64562.1 hypothetical protein SHALO_0780 [Sulfurospirillum halorespirans DSM 13726]
MALPIFAAGLFGTMVSRIVGFFSSVGPLATFFVWIGKKFAVKGVTVPIQLAVVGALVVSKVAFLIAILTLLATIYNLITSFLNMIPSLLSSDSILVIALQVMQAIGLLDAVTDAFAVFTLLFGSLLALFISKVVLHALKDASDEFFKIAILLGE